MGHAGKKDPILESPRFTFVRVAEKKLRHIAFGNKGPLDAGREAGAPAATQSARLDLFNDLIRLQCLQHSLRRLITGHGAVPLEGNALGMINAVQKNLRT